MKNSMPTVTVHQARNTCCKSYSTAACLLIRLSSIGGNAFCIFRIDKDDAARWCCISRGEIRRERETIGMANLKTSFSFVSAPGISYLCAIF